MKKGRLRYRILAVHTLFGRIFQLHSFEPAEEVLHAISVMDSRSAGFETFARFSRNWTSMLGHYSSPRNHHIQLIRLGNKNSMNAQTRKVGDICRNDLRPLRIHLHICLLIGQDLVVSCGVLSCGQRRKHRSWKIYIDKIRYQETTTEDVEEFMCAAVTVIFRVCKPARLLL
jgi:hypothetical protein